MPIGSSAPNTKGNSVLSSVSHVHYRNLYVIAYRDSTDYCVIMFGFYVDCLFYDMIATQRHSFVFLSFLIIYKFEI